MYGYCSEKLHFNHFWKLKGQGSRMVGAWGKMGNIMGKMDGGGAVLKLDLKWVNQLLTLM